MNRHRRVSVSSNCPASVLTGRCRAISTAHASNRSVNPLPGLAHGGGHRPHPVHGTGDAGHGGVDERLVLEEVQVSPHALPRVMHRTGAPPRQPVSGQWKRTPGSKPIMMCSPRPPSPASLKSTDPTFQGPRNCNAAVNRQEVSMPPTHPPASPHTTTTHHKQRKAQIVIVR